MQVRKIQNSNYNQYNQNFYGKLKLNSQNMDVFDLDLLQNYSGDLVEYAEKQKFDYILNKAFNRMEVFLEKDGEVIDTNSTKYKDKSGNRHIDWILETMENITKKWN